MIEYVNIFLSDFLNYLKTLNNMSEDLTLDQFRQHQWIEEKSPVRGVTNTNSKVNVNNVKIGSSSKTNKHLNVNKSVNGFRRTTPRILTMTSRICHVSFVERKTVHAKNEIIGPNFTWAHKLFMRWVWGFSTLGRSRHRDSKWYSFSLSLSSFFSLFLNPYFFPNFDYL